MKPICSGDTSKWCSLTKKCEKNCVSQFESITKRYEAFYSCQADAKQSYCSAEETCQNELKCPTSITKSIASADPTAFEVVKELYNSQATGGSKIVTPIAKALNEDDTTDMNLPYAGMKTHVEEAYGADLFLAFRCEDESDALCAKIPFE